MTYCSLRANQGISLKTRMEKLFSVCLSSDPLTKQMALLSSGLMHASWHTPAKLSDWRRSRIQMPVKFTSASDPLDPRGGNAERTDAAPGLNVTRSPPATPVAGNASSRLSRAPSRSPLARAGGGAEAVAVADAAECLGEEAERYLRESRVIHSVENHASSKQNTF